jgi:hypothetical protein
MRWRAETPTPNQQRSAQHQPPTQQAPAPASSADSFRPARHPPVPAPAQRASSSSSAAAAAAAAARRHDKAPIGLTAIAALVGSHSCKIKRRGILFQRYVQSVLEIRTILLLYTRSRCVRIDLGIFFHLSSRTGGPRVDSTLGRTDPRDARPFTGWVGIVWST